MIEPDRIHLRGLRIFGRHGPTPLERADGQDFITDAVLWLDTAAAAAGDDLTLTVDYGVLASQLAALIAGEPVALIETLAHRLALACLEQAAVSQVEVTVHKKPAAGVRLDGISVTVRRSRT